MHKIKLHGKEKSYTKAIDCFLMLFQKQEDKNKSNVKLYSLSNKVTKIMLSDLKIIKCSLKSRDFTEILIINKIKKKKERFGTDISLKLTSV